jgi:hypothetical protein
MLYELCLGASSFGPKNNTVFWLSHDAFNSLAILNSVVGGMPEPFHLEPYYFG